MIIIFGTLYVGQLRLCFVLILQTVWYACFIEYFDTNYYFEFEITKSQLRSTKIFNSIFTHNFTDIMYVLNVYYCNCIFSFGHSDL